LGKGLKYRGGGFGLTEAQLGVYIYIVDIGEIERWDLRRAESKEKE
jgi:hypothetical protein